MIPYFFWPNHTEKWEPWNRSGKNIEVVLLAYKIKKQFFSNPHLLSITFNMPRDIRLFSRYLAPCFIRYSGVFFAPPVSLLSRVSCHLSLQPFQAIKLSKELPGFICVFTILQLLLVLHHYGFNLFQVVCSISDSVYLYLKGFIYFWLVNWVDLCF